ncbi:MAG: MBL fold metallo-hydrolase RNA specificity domain-containing protein [Hyphomicrobiales bacterium]
MRLHFHGACRTVTGSCFLLEGDRARILVDCGMVQGSKTEKELNYRAFPFQPGGIDALVLTHAHIDHSGLIPKLVKQGFDGPIFATRATADLCSIMLRDSGHIQEMEVEQLNRRNPRRGHATVQPIYTAEDAVACLTQFRSVPYGEWTKVAEGFRMRFWNAGHLLGSACAEIEALPAGAQGKPLRLLFSGDVGPHAKLLESDPGGPQGIDHLVCESTYGDVERPAVSEEARRKLLLDEARGAAQRKGALLIPSFAVERTQELLVDLVGLMEAGTLAPCPIFINSPLASRASAVFAAHAGELEHGDALVRAMAYRTVRFTETTEESKAILRVNGFHIVIAASGMCEAGRIRHHLKAWLWRPEATVLLVGYQAQGTLGRILLDGAKRVRIMGEEIEVRARIHSLDLYSGHADGAELMRWIRARTPIAGRLFLVHGEQHAMDGLSSRLSGLLPAAAIVIPTLDEVFELTAQGALRVEGKAPARLAPEKLGRIDWHNDLSRLILDINVAVRGKADERGRQKLIRQLQRALADESATS